MKTFTIITHRNQVDHEKTGTIAELIKYFSYTLDVGRSWEHEKGNAKININPKSGATLVKNLNNAVNNAAANGYSTTRYSLK